MWRVKFSLLLALTAASSGCSSLDTIAILNNTEAPLQLQYTFKRDPSDDRSVQRRLSIIATVASGKAGDLNCPWVLLRPSDYAYDQTTETVVVQVPPTTAVRIAELSNYLETDERAADKFPIASVSIDGVRGNLHFDGEQARKQFLNAKRSLHAIDYR